MTSVGVCRAFGEEENVPRDISWRVPGVQRGGERPRNISGSVPGVQRRGELLPVTSVGVVREEEN